MVPKPNVILFVAQVILIFIVVCVSLLNLTMLWGNINMWTVILTGALAAMMPNPKLRPDLEKIDLSRPVSSNLE